MGKFTLITGPAGPYYFFSERILASASSGKTDHFIYFLPVNRAVRYFKKKMVACDAAAALLDAPVFTFDSFVRYLYKYYPEQKKIIGNTSRLILLSKIIKTYINEFFYFSKAHLINRGLINKIDLMLSEFCRFGYQPGDFQIPPQTAGIKYKDFELLLLKLHHSYEDRLIDESNLVPAVINNLDEERFKKQFPHVSDIFINGYGIFTPPMLDFLKIVAQWCNITIKLDYTNVNTALFRHTQDAYNNLCTFADQIREDSTQQKGIWHHLYKDPLKIKKNPASHPVYSVHKTKNRLAEVAFIAVKIKEIVQKNQIAASTIGVTFPNLETYVPLIRQVFKEYEIPYNLSTGFSLSQSPLIQLFLDIFNVILSGYESKEVYAFLFSPFLKFRGKESLGELLKLTQKLRIHFLNEDGCEKAETYLSRRVSVAVGSDRAEKNSIISLKTTFDDLRATLNILQSMPYFDTPSKLLEAYLKILKQLGLLSWYQELNDYLTDSEQEREFRAFNRFIKILNQTIWTLNFESGAEKISIKDFSKYLKLVSTEATYNLREWSNYGVQILPRLEIQAAESKILFLGGLIEGDFPRRFRRDIFFSDEERKQMGLTASEELIDQDRFLFYQLLSGCADQIILTYPAYDNETSNLPSSFLNSLREIINLTEHTDDLPEHLISGGRFIEHMASMIPEGLTQEAFDLLQNWKTVGNKADLDYWREGVSVFYAKISRSARTRFEGKINHNKYITSELKKQSETKVYSISALESYAFCPMQYFLRRLLGIPEQEEIDDSISAQEKGLLIHHILFLFYTRLKKLDALRYPQKYLNLLIDIARQEIARLPYTGISWTLEQELFFGTEEQEGLWQVFLNQEQEKINQSKFLPAFFEIGFGRVDKKSSMDDMSGERPIHITGQDRNIQLVGKIDRIDIDSKGRLMIIDYKTGGSAEKIKLKHILEGKSLQLPAYIEAAGQVLQNTASAVAAVYYQVKNSLYCKKVLVFSDNEQVPEMGGRDTGIPNKKYLNRDGQPLTFSQVKEITSMYIEKYVSEIEDGFFTHTTSPDDERCSRYCTFSKICRKDVGKLLAANQESVN